MESITQQAPGPSHAGFEGGVGLRLFLVLLLSMIATPNSGVSSEPAGRGNYLSGYDEESGVSSSKSEEKISGSLES